MAVLESTVEELMGRGCDKDGGGTKVWPWLNTAELEEGPERKIATAAEAKISVISDDQHGPHAKKSP